MNTEQQQGREQSMLEDIRKSGRTKIIEPDREAFQAAATKAQDALQGRWGPENLARLRQEIAKVRGS
jgi:TRAP-type C4-dicarboxylate transport system substrate-binding protein